MAPDTIPDFDPSPDEEHEDAPSYTFRLDGREWDCRQSEDVPFDVVEAITGLNGGGGRVGTDAFFAGVLVADQVEDFLAMKRRVDSPLTVRNAQQLIQAISEAVMGRPTKRSAQRERGSKRTGRSSTAA